MKTKSLYGKMHSRPRLSRLRLAAAGTLFLAAAGLAATAMQRPKLPWAAPTVRVGNAPIGVAVDRATNTIYVANAGSNSVSVIDGSKCKAANASLCSPIATLTHVGPSPIMLAFDQTTGTLYVTDGETTTGDDGNTIAVLNGKTCNATNTSGCGQMPAAIVTVPGDLNNLETGANGLITLDPPKHTLYIGDANDGPVLLINTATCNAMNTYGCSQVTSTMANGDAIAIDYSNQSVYVTDANDQTVSVFNGATCNATTQSDCTQFSVAPLPVDFAPITSAVDQATHTLYVPLAAFTDILGYTGGDRRLDLQRRGPLRLRRDTAPCPGRELATTSDHRSDDKDRLRSEPARWRLRIIRKTRPFTRRTRKPTLSPLSMRRPATRTTSPAAIRPGRRLMSGMFRGSSGSTKLPARSMCLITAITRSR